MPLPFKYQAKTFTDFRGSLNKLEPSKGVPEALFDRPYRDIYYSISARFTFRGLHWQDGINQQTKIIRVISGAINSYMVNVNRASPNYRAVYSFQLNHSMCEGLLCPPLHANGFLAIEECTIVLVGSDRSYDPASEHSMSPMSIPGIQLPNNVIISAKDLAGISYTELH